MLSIPYVFAARCFLFTPLLLQNIFLHLALRRLIFYHLCQHLS